MIWSEKITEFLSCEKSLRLGANKPHAKLSVYCGPVNYQDRIKQSCNIIRDMINNYLYIGRTLTESQLLTKLARLTKHSHNLFPWSYCFLHALILRYYYLIRILYLKVEVSLTGNNLVEVIIEHFMLKGNLLWVNKSKISLENFRTTL